MLTCSFLFNLWDVPTPPTVESSKGASIQGSTFEGQITSSSTKIVILVCTSGMARHICLLLFASRILRTLIFLALIAFAILVKASALASTVTKIISYGSDFRQVRSVCSSSSPPVAMVGQMIVTSWELYVGFSGIGIGLKVQWETQFTIKRIYRNNLVTWLVSMDA